MLYENQSLLKKRKLSPALEQEISKIQILVYLGLNTKLTKYNPAKNERKGVETLINVVLVICLLERGDDKNMITYHRKKWFKIKFS